MMLFLHPLVSAHGPGNYWVIIRSSSIQPEQAEVMNNDTILFRNTMHSNLTLLINKSSKHTVSCELPQNSSCFLNLVPENWTAGDYSISIMNGSTQHSLFSLKILPDVHDNDSIENTTLLNETEFIGPSSSEDINHSQESVQENIPMPFFVLFISFVLAIANKNMQRKNNTQIKNNQVLIKSEGS